MTKSILIKEENDWVTVAMRDPKDSDVILTIENHSLTPREVLTFLADNGIISLTDEL